MARSILKRTGAGTVAVVATALALLAGCHARKPIAEADAPEPAVGRFRVERDLAVPMRDGIVLRADVYRPATVGRLPRAGVSHALRQAQRGRQLPDTPEGRRTQLRRRAPGRARTLWLGRAFRSLPAGGCRRLRHDRMGRLAALVQRSGRHVRPVVSGCRAMAGRDGGAAASGCDGTGHDLLVASELLLFERRVRPLLAALDLRQHRAGYPHKTESARHS